MTDWANSDLGDFKHDGKSDKDKILGRIWVPCRICRERFERVRLTSRYCYTCERGYCEGEHGSFDPNAGRFYCVRHDPRLAAHDSPPWAGGVA